MSSLRRLYDDLRSICVAVVYPPGEDRDVLLDQLKRIGCRLKVIWPFPAEPPTGCDVIFFQVSQELQGSASWSASAVEATLVALSDYESPTTLKLLLDTSAHGVITRPFRSSGVLSTLVLARSSRGYQERLQSKVNKLEDTIRSRRLIEKAVRLLTETQNLSESKAYEHMRSRATALRVTVAEVAAMVVEAHEAMEKLGFGRTPGA
ncbi:Two-component response regulator, AmiR/NasT family, consists of REC and RNA-binding antiterminator (ANTAR) domains [Variovorax sp. YR266]|uniref:ANTAR domain-containing response regulator n=1 Tax=Variovorax sp. YR266 TaxID=1884386 RepID=UPI0008973215|nr:ANTAR domain-containing protein [Variovorax sp. YR266]SDZ70756.1 Two-component response regulator, AmiR/NasT family, consists of REC and RNA-binding antiterminator (ANTAR) domains [Variovorax sp. YR266]